MLFTFKMKNYLKDIKTPPLENFMIFKPLKVLNVIKTSKSSKIF